MKRIGITGGIGAGKSTGAAYLGELGFAVLDTDDVARGVVEPGSAALAEIVGTFGPGILHADGSLNRGKLAGVVFADPEARRHLEGILHPRIQKVWTLFLEERKAEGVALAAVVIPLLFEKGYGSRFDAVIAVGCTPGTQIRRLRDRGWSHEAIQARLTSQWPMEAKLAAAAHVVWNEGTLVVQETQWDRILDHLLPGLMAGMAARSAGN